MGHHSSLPASLQPPAAIQKPAESFQHTISSSYFDFLQSAHCLTRVPTASLALFIKDQGCGGTPYVGASCRPWTSSKPLRRQQHLLPDCVSRLPHVTPPGAVSSLVFELRARLSVMKVVRSVRLGVRAVVSACTCRSNADDGRGGTEYLQKAGAVTLLNTSSSSPGLPGQPRSCLCWGCLQKAIRCLFGLCAHVFHYTLSVPSARHLARCTLYSLSSLFCGSWRIRTTWSSSYFSLDALQTAASKCNSLTSLFCLDVFLASLGAKRT